MANKDLRLVVRIDAELKEDLEKLAEISRRKVSDYVRLLIEDAIKKKTKK